MLSRRDFLKSASALALLKASPAFAWSHGSAQASGFNGGLSQGQSLISSLGFFDWPFINFLKNQQATWAGSDTTNNGSDINPAWLSSDGYPNQVGTNGVYLGVQLPASSSFTGNMTLMWDVTGAGSSDVATLAIGNFSTTPVSGSLSSTGNGTNFTYVFALTGQLTNAQTSFQLAILSLGGTAHVTNIRLYWSAHVAAANAGELLNPQFKSLLQSLKFGVFRFMDWFLTNQSNVTTWSTRKSVGYPTYAASEYRASLYPGDIMTNSGNDYSLTFGSGGPTDKQTIHILLSANSTLVQNSEAGGGGTLTLTLPGGGSAVTFNWTAHGLSNGTIVSVNTGFLGGSPIQNFWSGTNYYVVNVTANTFQVSLTSGGAAVGSTTTSSGGNTFVTRLQTLNLNSTGAIPFRDTGGNPFVASNAIPVRTLGVSTVLRYGTAVYDVKLNSWLLVGCGGSSSQFSSGILNFVPPEICLQLCQELGMHPHLSIPYMALDTITDYVPSLATYIKNNMPSWMIPHFEPGNEVWNGAQPITKFAWSKAFINWGQASFNADDWYGMVLSLMGQAVATVYGAGNLGTKYEVMCGVQTDSFGLAPFINTSNPRLLSTQFVASGPTPPAGYTRTTAKTYTSVMLCATYVVPGMRGNIPELINAWQYYVTNVGNAPAQATNLNAYANSLNQGVSGAAVLSIASPGVVNWPSHGRSVGDWLPFSTTGTFPTGVSNSGMYVSNVVDANHFNVSTSPGGASVNFTGSQSGTQYVSYGSFSNVYLQARYVNLQNLGSVNGVNKLFAYEGGYSPDLVAGGGTIAGLSSAWLSPITGATNAASCVLTLASTQPPDISANAFPLGNPAIAGMALCVQGVSGMTQLNCANGVAVTLTSGTASIPYAGNTLVANQGIVFEPNPNITFPTNISPDTVYYVSATGLSSSAFQISATSGGAVITPTGSGGPFNLTIDVGWVVTSVAGNSVTILCNSTGFGTYVSGGNANYLSGAQLVNKFRLAVLQSATALPSNLLANYNNFTAAGGAFPSQFGIAAGGTIWCCIEGDMYQPLNEQGNMIVAYN